ncbi:MAG: hypothetical protein ACREAD_00480 [Nitrosopumilaceae archaeon]
MSEPENQPPPKDNSERESIFRVLDELVSHMQTSRNVSMLLIVSAFILTPISLVIAVLLLSAPAFVPGAEVHFVNIGMANGTSGVEIGGSFNTTVPPGFIIQKGVNMSSGKMVMPGEVGNMYYQPVGPPKFMLSGGGPFMHQVLDISTVIIIFIIVSIVLSSIWLFIGIKEYSFFSKWNKKFTRFMSLKDKVDKALGEDET